jgi:NAD(P)-dependent dehydrogenase (short-subunit alcohol dehydrogenase family)
MADSNARKVAFVTGAGSGIGRATAAAFVAAGYATALVDRDEDHGRAVEAELRKGGGECLFIACDVTEDSSVKRAVEQAVGTFGRLDAAFNAAGIDGEKGLMTADCTVENWHRVLTVDLTGVWHCMRHQIPQMLKSGGGAIVNCASVAGLVGAPTFAAYTAAKHGVVGLTKAAALEYARRGIRVNAVCPGMIDTPMNAHLDPDMLKALLAESPMGRLGRPEGIASAVLFLCDDGANFLTGQAIAIDGAWTAR